MIKHGIIGFGIGKWHLQEIENVEGMRVVAVADLSEERRQEARKLGAEKTYEDYRALCEDKDLDSVSICLPNALHADAAVLAFECGKHVLVEKPLADNLESGERIIEAQRKSGNTGMVAMKFRYKPEAAWIRAAVDRGDFGDVHHTRTTYLRQPSGVPSGAGNWFIQKKLSGGGAIIDNGVHLLDLQWFLMGSPSPEGVLGATRADFGPRIDENFDVDDFGTALIRFRNGATAFLENAWASMVDETKHHLLCLGTKGGATMWPFKVVQGDEKEVRDITPSPEELPDISQFSHFAECIRENKIPTSPLEEGIALLKMLGGIYDSSEQAKEMKLGD